MKRLAHGSRPTCLPIRFCSTSFTRCSWRSANRTAGAPRAAGTARCAPTSGAAPRRAERLSRTELRENCDDALRGVGHRQRAGVLAHLLEPRGISEKAADVIGETRYGERRLRQDDRTAQTLHHARVLGLLVPTG